MTSENELEKSLIEAFENTTFDDVHFDKTTVEDVHVADGKAVGIYNRTYETYRPGRDTDYSGIVYTDGENFRNLIYQKAMDTKGEFIDEDRYISKILEFDGQKVIYQTREKNQKSVEVPE